MAGWSNAIVDLDNDGWKDLIVARSNVTDNIALFSQRAFEEPNAVFRNLGNGRFQDVSATAGPEFQIPGAHRGLAFGDLDNDGRMDIAVSVWNGQAKIFHNTTRGGNHWLLLQLLGSRSNRMGLGARIRLTGSDGAICYNHASISTGYAASSDPRVHFGLGGAAGFNDLIGVKSRPLAQRHPAGAARCAGRPCVGGRRAVNQGLGTVTGSCCTRKRLNSALSLLASADLPAWL